LLAALTPAGHTITLLDENVEPIDFDHVARADIVGVTGMSVQRFRLREILTELKERDAFTVVGGPWVSVREDYFGPLADVIFVGEAEETWPRFLDDWQAGRHVPRYEQAEKSDMTRVPTPRFDLLKMKEYMFGSVQFSRGCPFQCEFCDIIVTFGRRPRLKTSAQVLAELDALLDQGISIAFIVDDNLIGNKRAIKEVLRDLISWQEKRGYPLALFTEASLDLADEPDLLDLMVRANFVSVFVGIETPNEASLRETKKLQNVRRGGTILGRVHAIQNAGLEVFCGMILGFDNDDPSIFDAQREFLREARITTAMVGMLAAIPKTPLYDRLQEEGRLDTDDVSEYGTNVIPLRMSRQALRDGYVGVLQDLYEPEAYFDRLDDLYLRGRAPHLVGQKIYWRRHPLHRLKTIVSDIALAAGVFARLMTRVSEPALRRVYRRRIAGFLRRRPDPHLLFVYAIKCAMHYHHHTMATRMADNRSEFVNSF
jgi:radical SAM superfamily enzyme YgiQ (UPF0313 family)